MKYKVERKDELPKATIEKEWWATPIPLCRTVLREVVRIKTNVEDWPKFHQQEQLRILDPGAGTGNWGVAAREVYPDAWIAGNEIRDSIKRPDVYDEWMVGDFLEMKEEHTVSAPFNLVIGNPPFSLMEDFIKKGLELTSFGGFVVYLMRLSFLEGRRRQLSLYEPFPPNRILVLTRRIPFYSEMGITKKRVTGSSAYAVGVWWKGYRGATILDWLYWEYDDAD